MRAALALLSLTPTLAAALEVRPVAQGVWTLVGGKAQRSASNLVGNAIVGVVETAKGVVPVDPGGSRKGAVAIHATIRTLSDKPVVWGWTPAGRTTAGLEPATGRRRLTPTTA